MNKFGKINIFGRLEYAPNIITKSDGSVIVNPSDSDYIENGYKYIIDNGIPDELIGKNIEKYYEQTDIEIYIKYRESENTEPPIETN